MRLTGWIGMMGMIAMSMVAVSADELPWRVPLETVNIQRAWEGKGNFRHIVDAPTGQVVLEYVEELTGQGTSITLDIDRNDWRGLDLGNYDLLRFDWRSVGDAVLAQVSIEGYPENRRRNWYLNKNPGEPGDWQRVWLELHRDDDNPFLPNVEVPEGKLRLRFAFNLNPVVQHSPKPKVVIRLAEVMLLRLPVKLEGDLRAIRPIRESGRVGQAYELTVTNQTQEEQTARIYLDTAGLQAFDAFIAVLRETEQVQLTLAARESKTFEVHITTSEEQADKLPPLYLEEASIFVGAGNLAVDPDTVAPWLWGYMQHTIRGAVPLPERPAPRLLPKAEAEAGHARLAGQAESVADKRLIEAADRLLAADLSIPDIIGGNPNSYFCPEHNAQMRFHGPGKHKCDKGGEFVDEKAMPEPLLKAAYYAHHGWLANGSLTLARAGWESGERKYLEKAAEVLLAYAEKYPNWPVADPTATAFYARATRGNLQESWWFAPLPRAYDLVMATDIWSPEQAEKVRRDLILEGVVLLRSHRSIANQQAEYNRGVGVGALAIGHSVLAADALAGEYGMRAQWKLDFDGDGWTMERDGGYQRAAIEPFLDFAKALAANDVPVFDEDFKKLFDAPIKRSTGLVSSPGHFYEEAYAHYLDPIYLRSIAAAKREPLPELPEGFPNSTLEAAGYTILRSGTSGDNLVSASINWGEPSHRSGRVLLNPMIHWQGHRLNAQVERISYGSKTSGFSYTAAAGNSIVVNGQLQTMARAQQTATVEGLHPAGRWTAPATRPQYPGMEWSRSLAICGDQVLVLDQWSSTRPVRIDRFSYLPVVLASAQTGGSDALWQPLGDDFAQQGNGYGYFLEPRLAPGGASASIRYTIDDKSKAFGRLQLLAPESTDLLTMQAPIGWHPRNVSVLGLRQTEATSGWFASVYGGANDPAALDGYTAERLPVTQDGEALSPTVALALRVSNPSGTFLVLTSSRGGTHSVAGHELEGPLAVSKLSTP